MVAVAAAAAAHDSSTDETLANQWLAWNIGRDVIETQVIPGTAPEKQQKTDWVNLSRVVLVEKSHSCGGAAPPRSNIQIIRYLNQKNHVRVKNDTCDVHGKWYFSKVWTALTCSLSIKLHHLYDIYTGAQLVYIGAHKKIVNKKKYREDTDFEQSKKVKGHYNFRGHRFSCFLLQVCVLELTKCDLRAELCVMLLGCTSRWSMNSMWWILPLVQTSAKDENSEVWART